MTLNIILTGVFSIILILLQLLDVSLTRKVIAKGGVELNPLIKKYGYWIKIPVVMGAIVTGILIHWLILVIPVLLMIGVCIWNLFVLKGVSNE